MDVGGLQGYQITCWSEPSDSRVGGASVPGEMVSVSNSTGSSVQVSGARRSARRPPSLFRELRGAVCGGSHYLYIGDSYGHRIGFDTEAIGYSRPGDRTHEKAEFKIARLEHRFLDRQLDLGRAVADAARDNGKRKNRILDVNRRRLLQAQALKTRLGDALSSQIRLDDLINQYESFSVGITHKSPPTPGISTQAVTRG